MKKIAKKLKGKKVLSLLLAMIMVLSVSAPAISPIANALGTNSYDVELAFNNLFVFDDWANNDLSTTVMLSGNDGTIDIDVESGSFKLTKTNMEAAEIFTAFSMDTEKASGNTPYYNMAVEPNTTYKFSYNVSGNIWVFTPYVFFYDSDGLYHSLMPYPTPGYGVNSFEFTTPDNVTSIQIRWTISDTSASRPDMTSVYADVSEIKIYKVESILDETDLFDFATWSTKAGSGAGTSVYGAGSHTAENGRVTITSNGTDNLGGCSAYLTNFSTAAYDDTAFVVDTEPGKTYTLTYNLDSFTTAASANMMALIPWYDTNKTWISSYGQYESVLGKNSFTFTVPDNVYHFQIVFGLYDFEMTNGKNATVSNIELHESVVVEHVTDPHRKLYNYTYNGANSTYGELPTPTYIPDGYVFGGWYTGLNGTGERITPETYVKMDSFSVFANFEPEVTTLELATAPNKTTYTVGEKLNTTGLSLKATINSQVDADGDGTVETVTRTFYVNSDIYCTPAYLTTAGTQTITAHYGGKTVTFPVTVLTNDTSDIVVNGTVMSDVPETNLKYTLNASADPFNRYKITYYTDSYVKGIITLNDGAATEEFFLEPGDNETFVSFVDNFLDGNTYSKIDTIEFTCLNNELGDFQLKAVSTEFKEGIPEIEYFNNAKYEMGIDIRYGGVVSELYDKSDKNVTARVYNTTFESGVTDSNGNKITENKTMTLVDYEAQLNEREDNYTVGGTNYGALTSNGETSNRVNLINTLDRGRYLQQSYYGTDDDPYIQGRFNDAPWKYNPVQGGNVAEEPSKVIDYEVTDTYIYIKARPMEWEKWSDDHVDECNHWVSTVNGTELAHTEKLYGNDVVSDTYVEAWYYFDDGMIKVTNRKVDYSGLPEKYTQQEMPALYLIEPLNHFVYNDVSSADAWTGDFDGLGEFNSGSLKNIEEPEFWGIVDNYNEYHYVTRDAEGNIISVVNDSNGDNYYDLSATCNENWAAFTASEDPESFGVGIYTPGVTEMYYGVMPQIYASSYDRYGNVLDNSNNLNYRHTETIEPTTEMPTSYIAPLKEEWFRSYEATEYTYYLKTGTAEEIYDGFSTISDKETAEELAKTKIAVPETVYVNPSDYKAGQYYVNNILNESNYYNVETEAVSNDTEMYFGIHVNDGVSFSATVTNVTDPSNEITLGYGDGTGTREGETINFDTGLIDSYISKGGFSLRLTNALSPGQKVTAKWDITVTLSSGATETHTVYTVLYAPGLTVGAVAEGRYNSGSQNEISSWITGANGVDHSQRAPLGSFHGDKRNSGYFRMDPLVYPDTLPTGGSSETSSDYILGYGTQDADDYTDNAYVMQTATNGSDGSRSQSYLGLLKVDKSRYTNTNQIPNLKIGYDALRVGSEPEDSLNTYNTYYTLGTAESFTATDLSATPSGWTTHESYDELKNSHEIPYRSSLIPAYSVSDIDGKYIHAIAYGIAADLFGNRHSTAGTSVLISVTDKSGLRDAVLEGYNKPDADEEYLEKLENAATVLGDPSATQDEIDKAKQELNETATAEYYSLKYDNIFSAYEFSLHAPNMTVVSSRGTVAYNNGAITVTNAALTDANEAYTNYGSTDNYYLVDLKPGTEYVFEYDVTTTVKAQAFMFFYNASGGNGDVPTNMSVKTNSGSWGSKSESNPWFGNYTNSAGTYHYAIKFTTGANTTQAGFRFGNTSSSATTSIFSNIKLVTSDKYYEDATYSATETVHKENTAYGTLPELTRTGYTFGGWKDASNNTITGETIATQNLSIYSQWTENTYTIKFDANGGTGTIADKTVSYTQSVVLPAGGVTNVANKLVLKGWATTPDATEPTYQLGQSVSKLTSTANGVVTLYAVWGTVPPVNVTFDNLVDISVWSDTVNNGTPVNETDTGFTVKSNEGVGEATCLSAYFTIEAGHKYVVEADIKGDAWDIYFFFCDANGNWVDFADGKNRLASNGLNVSEVNGIKYTSTEFTAPTGSVKAQLRVDANGSDNAVRFENIRVYDTENTTYLDTVNKYVEYGENYGVLPVPVKEDQVFLGWKDAEGNIVTADTVMDSTSTVFLTSTWTTNANAVNNDTVVVEYGLPVKINVLSNDDAGKVTSVNAIGTLGVSDSNLGNMGYPSSKLTDKANSLALNNGKVTLNSDGTVTYTATNTNAEAEDVFYYEVVVNGSFYYAKVTVIPATTIYYEDTFFQFNDATVTKGSTTYNYNWQTVGQYEGDIFQSIDRPGAYNFTDDLNNAYGFDAAYDGDVAYSDGTAHFVEVDRNAGANGPTAVFTFTGTGFDLFSTSDSKAGTVTVTIYRGTAIDASKRVQGIMSNAYFGYSYDSESGEYVPADNGAIYQVPVINARDLGYGTYTVVVMPRYNQAFDVANTGKAGAYVDSVRIYDPMGSGNAVANEAYMADGEYSPKYLEIRDTLVTPKGDGSYTVSDLGLGKSVFLDGGKSSMDDFAKFGPKNEVYLGKNDSVSFHIVTDRPGLPSTVQLGMKLTGKGGSTATVNLMNTDYNGWSEDFALNSATERYYNIESVVDWVEQSDGTYKTASPVVVTNTSDAVISLTSLKWAFNSDSNTATVLSLLADEQTPVLAQAAIMRAINPGAQSNPQQTILAKDNIAVDISGEPLTQGDSGVLTITTEQGVAGVTVNGTDVLNPETDGNGKFIWTYEFTADVAGEMTFEIIARDENGITSEAIYASTEVETDSVSGGGEADDTVTGEDGSDAEEDSDSGISFMPGDDLFAYNLVRLLFQLFEKILSMLSGGAAI